MNQSELKAGYQVCTVVRAFASLQCGPGTIPGLIICGLSLLLVLVLILQEVFLLVLWFSPLLTDQHFQIPIKSGICRPQVCQS